MKLKLFTVLYMSLLLTACASNSEFMNETDKNKLIDNAEMVEESVSINEIEESTEEYIEDIIVESVSENINEEPYVNMIIGDSQIFSEDEIKNALFQVYDNFVIPDATLLKVWYDEDKSEHWKSIYMESGRGS